MSELVPTPSQTVGPFFRFGLAWLDHPEPGAGGIVVHGAVLDGSGDAVPDAVVETWQADPGLFRRSLTDEDGQYRVTVATPGPEQHIDVSVFARGLLQRLATRIYLPGGASDTDRVLASVPPARRHTLVAVPDDLGLRFDIRLQGAEETVFFAW
jgi:protocatechuate 3,4-dioxygenase alpha subunit